MSEIFLGEDSISEIFLGEDSKSEIFEARFFKRDF